MTLTSAGTISDASNVITAATLSGSSVGGATLTGANVVNKLGAFTTTSSGTLSFTDSLALTVTGIVTTAGNMTLTDTAAGGITTTLTTGTLSTGGNGNITLTADAVSLGGAVTAASHTVTIQPNSPNTAMGLTTGTGSGLNLGTTGALSNITASTLVLGSATATGVITIGAVVSVPSAISNLTLITNNATSSAITIASTNSLTLANTGGNITLQANSLSLTSTANPVISTGSGSAGTVTLVPNTAGTAVTIASSAGYVTATSLAQIKAGTLVIGGANAGTIAVNQALNPTNVTNLQLVSGSGNITVGQSVTASGAVTLTATGNLTIAFGAQVTSTQASGNSVVLSATGNFVNNQGSNAVSVAGTARWLIYSNAPSTDTFGNLDSTNVAIWNNTYATLAPSSVTLSGNRYIFAYASGTTPATLTYTANAVSQSYGTAIPSFTGTIFGLQSGVANAFLADTNATAFSGTLAFTSTATQASNVASYAINGSGLTANNGYNFVQAAGNATALNITPATLTYTANAVSQSYGTAIPSLSGAVSGFVLGQTQGTATTGTLSFNTAATQASNVATYAITGLGLTANNGNYNFVQAAGNATALNITPATLTYTANAVSQSYGTAIPSLSGAVSGFVLGQTQGTATTGTLSFNTAATQASNVATYAITG